MSFHKASKKDEEELKEYTTAKATVEESKATVEEPKTNTKGLQEELEGKTDKDGKKTGGRSLSLALFAKAGESYRKKVLGEDYAELKLKYCWKYDQPIE